MITVRLGRKTLVTFESIEALVLRNSDQEAEATDLGTLSVTGPLLQYLPEEENRQEGAP